MSKVKKNEGNIEVEIKLMIIDDMVNDLLNQMKAIKLEVDNFKKYPKEDIIFYNDKMMEIDNKIFQVRDIIDGK